MFTYPMRSFKQPSFMKKHVESTLPFHTKVTRFPLLPKYLYKPVWPLARSISTLVSSCFDRLWWALMSFGGLCWALVGFNELWWTLRGFEGLWGALMGVASNELAPSSSPNASWLEIYRYIRIYFQHISNFLIRWYPICFWKYALQKIPKIFFPVECRTESWIRCYQQREGPKYQECRKRDGFHTCFSKYDQGQFFSFPNFTKLRTPGFLLLSLAHRYNSD